MSVAGRGNEFALQTAATTGNGTAITCNPSSKHHTIIIKGTGTISGGAISIEEADAEDYTGTWSVISAVTAADVTAGAQKSVHSEGLIRALRARISTSITGGGSISAGYIGN